MNELDITLPSERELVATRVFAAPPSLVYECWTSPALLHRWYGPRGWSLVVCEIDLRVGGAWRFVSRKPDGREVGQHGIYRELVPGARIVHTESWEDWDPGELLVTVEFQPSEHGTRLTSTTLFPAREVRDRLLASGMNDGLIETYAKLDDVLGGKTG